MTLQEYMAETGVKKSSLADLAGLSRSQIGRLVSGDCTPTIRTMDLIEIATKGKVKRKDW